MKVFIALQLLFSFENVIASEEKIYGYTEIELVNYFYDPIKIEISSNKETLKTENNVYKENLTHEKRIYLTQNDYFIIENNKINFKVDNIMCAYVYVFGLHKKLHGRGISIYLNDEFKGTICANKKSIIDYKFNAKLTFNKDSDNNSYVQFINNGWWNSEETFPLSYTFPLEKL